MVTCGPPLSTWTKGGVVLSSATQSLDLCSDGPGVEPQYLVGPTRGWRSLSRRRSRDERGNTRIYEEDRVQVTT